MNRQKRPVIYLHWLSRHYLPTIARSTRAGFRMDFLMPRSVRSRITWSRQCEASRPRILRIWH